LVIFPLLIMNRAEKIFSFFKKLYDLGISVFKEREKVESVKLKVQNELKKMNEIFTELDEIMNRSNESSKRIESKLSAVYESLPVLISFYDKEIENLNEVLLLFEKLKMYTENLLEEIHHIEVVSRNSEIKAYHLGEKGKGLQVVSQELSKLAQRIISSARVISSNIENIQNRYTFLKNKQSKVLEQINSLKRYEASFKKIFEELKNSLSNFSDTLKDLRKIYFERKSLLDELFRNIIELEVKSLTLFSDSEKVLIYSEIFEGNEEILEGLYEILEKASSVPGILQNRVKGKIEFFTNNNVRIMEELNEKFVNFEKIKEDWEKKLKLIQSIISKIKIQDGNIKNLEARVMRDFKMNMSYYLDEVKNLNNAVKNFSYHITSYNQGTEIGHFGTDFLRFLRLMKEDLKDGEILSLYSSVETARAGIIEDPLSKELKERVKNSIYLSDEVIKIAEKINQITNKRNEISNEGTQKFVSIEDDIKLLDENFERISELTEVVNRDIDLFKNNFEIMENFIKNLSMKFKEIGEFSEEIKKGIVELRDEMIHKLPSKEEPKDEKIDEIVLKLPLSSNPASLDPYIATDATSNTILENVHRSLFMVSPKSSRVIPVLIERFEIGKDGRVYIFILRRNIKFHNGDYMTAYDVKDSLYRALRGNSKNYFDMIKGARDFIKEKKGDVEGIKVIDDHRIEIELEYPFVPFINNLSLTGAAVTKEENGKLYGLGPFVLEKYEKDKFVELKVFEDYFAGRACVDRVIFYIDRSSEGFVEMFLKGQLDLLEPSSKDEEILKEKAPAYLDRIMITPEFSIQRFDFNITKYPFNNVHFRRALNYAFDKEGFIRERMKGRAIKAEGIFPPSSEVYNPNLKGYEYDLEKARVELSKSGIKPPLKVKITITDSESYRRNAEFIENCFKKLGVEFEIEEKTWKEFLDDLHEGRTQCHMIGWVADTGDPDSIVYPLFHSSSIKSGANEMRYSNPIVDKLLEEARKIRIPEERKKLYQEIEKRILDDAPCIFLYHPYERILLSEKVLGIWPHPLGHYRIEIAFKFP